MPDTFYPLDPISFHSGDFELVRTLQCDTYDGCEIMKTFDYKPDRAEFGRSSCNKAGPAMAMPAFTLRRLESR